MTVRLTARCGGSAWGLAARRQAGVRHIVAFEGADRIAEVEGAGPIRRVSIDGRIFEACVARTSPQVDGARGEADYDVTIGGRLYAVRIADPLQAGDDRSRAARADGPTEIRSVMPGKVVQVLVAPGQEVTTGEGLVVVEAMKMENELTAPRPGRVVAVAARPGEAVEAGALLVTLD